MKLRLQNRFVHFQTCDVEEVKPRCGGVCVKVFFLISTKIFQLKKKDETVGFNGRYLFR